MKMINWLISCRLWMCISILMWDCSVGDTPETNSSHKIEKRIVNGDLVQPDQLPWMVYLRNSPNEFNHNNCTAFLVSDRWIITAKHCIAGYSTTTDSLKAAIFGVNGNEIPGLAIKRIVNYPFDNYFAGLNLNDISMLELQGKCTHVLPPDLDYSFISDNRLKELRPEGCGDLMISYVAGWGYSGISQELQNPMLRVAQTPLQLFSDVRMNLPTKVFDTDYNHYLFGGYFERSGPESCGGDSGSPLWLELNSKPKAVAITAAGFGGSRSCGEPGNLGIYLRLSRFEDFIISTKGLAGLRFWEWQNSLQGKSPLGSWHANGAYSDPEKICQVDGHPGIYDSQKLICFQVANDYQLITANAFSMPVGTLDYEYQWQAYEQTAMAFLSCIDENSVWFSNSGSGDVDNFYEPCPEYCRVMISGKYRVGIVRSGQCLTVNNHVLQTNSPPYQRLLARTPQEREEVCPVIASSTTMDVTQSITGGCSGQSVSSSSLKKQAFSTAVNLMLTESSPAAMLLTAPDVKPSETMTSHGLTAGSIYWLWLVISSFFSLYMLSQ